MAGEGGLEEARAGKREGQGQRGGAGEGGWRRHVRARERGRGKEE